MDYKLKNIFIAFGIIISLGVLVQSCKDKQSPGYEYMPDMYRSPSVETYGETKLSESGLSALQPVVNTIPRGFNLYPYPNTNDGYAAAGEILKNPVPFSEEVLVEGKVAYGKFCVHCHGKKGEGDGTVPTNSDYPSPPSYKAALKDLSEGKMFHTLMYGKNLMGSHASQISAEDRWKIVYYVQSLQDAKRFDLMYRGGDEESETTEMVLAKESNEETATNN
jgi:mono/diheme cytochrome c family protein